MPRAKKPPPSPDDMDEKLRQIFRDIAYDPAKRREAFDRLKAMEAASNVHYLPRPEGVAPTEAEPPAAEKKRMRSARTKRKAARTPPSDDVVKRVLKLWREYEAEINAILALGGRIATTVIGFLANRKRKALPAPAET